MPELDFMIISDFVRTDNGVLHIVAGGIDTIYTPAVPAVRSIGIGLRLEMSKWELTEDHQLRIIFQGTDGARIAEVDAAIPANSAPPAPAGRKTGVMAALNMPLPLPGYGDYSLELLVDGNEKKTKAIHVVQAEIRPDA